MVPPCSDRISRVPPYSRITRDLRVRGYHPLRPDFPDRSASSRATTGLLRFRSPLLAESLLMSVPPGTEMFQFPGFASPTYVFSERYPKGVGCPIRTSTDQRLLAAPHGFSQRATSFIASWCQGIHRMPFSCSIHTAPLKRRPTQGRSRRSNRTRHAQEPSTPNTQAWTDPVPRTGPAQHTTLFNAPEHCRQPWLSAQPSHRNNRATRSDNRHRSRRTPRVAPASRTHRAPDQKPPRCPARPETHQNLIHNPKEPDPAGPRHRSRNAINDPAPRPQ